ncbi:MAG: hypothetical protein BGO49_24740 [Planctomycetales bacterium 71-10]|nr:MAG: hypothetical protein BGO49_24740 [Planctomycetales bacterium 71-10]
MDFWLLYLMTRTDHIRDAMRLFAALVLIGGVVTFVTSPILLLIVHDVDVSDELKAMAKRWAKRVVIAASACGLISPFLPTRNDWYVMIGGYYVTQVEGIDKLPANVVGAANEFLERYQAEQDGPEVLKEGPKAKKQGGGA